MEVPYIDLRRTGMSIYKHIASSDYKIPEIAEMLDVYPQTVYKWVNGERLPQLEYLISMARLFNTTVEGLIGVKK